MTDTKKPFLITKDNDGRVRLTVRELRHNSQGYPWFISNVVDETFSTIATARAYAKQHFGAKAGEFATR